MRRRLISCTRRERGLVSNHAPHAILVSICIVVGRSMVRTPLAPLSVWKVSVKIAAR